MADTVVTQTIKKEGQYNIVHLMCRSDGTGESGVAKVTLSGLKNSQGQTVTRTEVWDMWWSIQGFASVQLQWDHTAPDTIGQLSGSGRIDYRGVGGLPDPASAGGTGNILLSSFGASSGATYDIVMVLKLI